MKLGLQSNGSSGKLVVKDGWLTCPCGRNHRLLRVLEDTEARCLQLYCRSCKQEIIVDIDKGQSVKRRGQ